MSRRSRCLLVACACRGRRRRRGRPPGAHLPTPHAPAAPTPVRGRSSLALRQLGDISSPGGPGTRLLRTSTPRGNGRCSSRDDAGERRKLASNKKLFTTTTALRRDRPRRAPASPGSRPRRRPPPRDAARQPLHRRRRRPAFGVRGHRRPRAGDDQATAGVKRRHAARSRRRLGLRPPPRRPGHRQAEPLHRAALRPLLEFGLEGPGFVAARSSTAGQALRQAPAEPRRRSRRQRRVGEVPGAARAGPTPIASHGSRRSPSWSTSTNKPSNNFFAEMLLKRLARRRRRTGHDPGRHARGRAPTRARSASASAPRTAPASAARTRPRAEQVGKLLTRDARRARRADEFHESLPLRRQARARSPAAWREPPPRAAAARKTGTISGVSDLSGYCDAPAARSPSRS